MGCTTMINIKRLKIKSLIKLKRLIKRFNKKKSSNTNNKAHKEQLKHLAILLSVLSAALGYYLYSTHETLKIIHQEQGGFDPIFNAKFNQNTDEALIEKQQNELNQVKDTLKVHEDMQKESSVESQKEKEAISAHENLFKEMQTKISQLEEDNKKIAEQLQATFVMNAANSKPQLEEKVDFESRNFETIRFNSRKPVDEVRTPDNYVWAGTIVEGYMESGATGDAGINGSKNQGTALIRLSSNGIMPNDKSSRLDGCKVIASYYGDLSAETIVMRPEVISCATRRINLEQKVFGAVYDLDAMQDVRGTAILKTKPLLTYTAAAGALVGIGTGLQNWGSAQSINSNGSIMTFSPSSMVRTASGAAMATPATKLADYIMKIAEIYHPLVVARAGRRITVLFTKGFWIDKAHQNFDEGNVSHSEAKPLTTTTTYTSLDAINANSGQNLPELKTDSLNTEGEFANQTQQSKPLFSSIEGG